MAQDRKSLPSKKRSQKKLPEFEALPIPVDVFSREWHSEAAIAVRSAGLLCARDRAGVKEFVLETISNEEFFLDFLDRINDTRKYLLGIVSMLEDCKFRIGSVVDEVWAEQSK